MTDFTYPKKEKLKQKSEIDLLFSKGKWKTNGNLRIIILKNQDLVANENVKIGVSVSKKFFKRAVKRNRIKRLLRECYRLNKVLFAQAFGDKTSAMLFWVSKEEPKNLQEIEELFYKLCKNQNP